MVCNTNTQHFLDGLWTKQEELASIGIEINEQDYWSTIVKSLPMSLANFTSSQLATMWLFASTKTIEPNMLILLITEEAELQKVKYIGGRSDTKDCNEAMAITMPT